MKAEEFVSLVEMLGRLRGAWYDVNRRIPSDYPTGPNEPIVTVAITVEGMREPCHIEVNNLSSLLRHQIERLETHLKQAVENKAIELY